MRVTNKMNHTKSPLITSPLFVMKKEIISLGKREPASMTDEEFEQRMLRILLKDFRCLKVSRLTIMLQKNLYMLRIKRVVMSHNTLVIRFGKWDQ